MMLTVDEVQKMKVVELRAELMARNLDGRGVKAVLVERLLDALMTESSSPEKPTSIAPEKVSVREPEPQVVQGLGSDANLLPTRARRSVNDSKATITPSPTSPVKVVPEIIPTSKPAPLSPQKVVVSTTPVKLSPQSQSSRVAATALAKPVPPEVSPAKPIISQATTCPPSPTKAGVVSPLASATKAGVVSPLASATKPGVASPLESATKAGVASPLESATQAGVASPLESATKAGVASPLESATKAGVASPLESATKAGVASPLESATKAGVASPLESATKAGVAAPLASPTKPGLVAPLASVTKAGLVSPLASSTKAGLVAPLASPTKTGLVAPLASPTKAGVAAPLGSPIKASAAVPLAFVTKAGAAALLASSPNAVSIAATPASALTGAGTPQRASLPQKVALSPAKPSGTASTTQAVVMKPDAAEIEAAVAATGESSVQSEPSPAEAGTTKEEAMEVEEGREDNKRKADVLNGNQGEETRKPKKFKGEDRKVKIVAENEPDFEGKGVILDWYKSDLNLRISETDFLKAEQIVFEEFPWAYAGVKATHGFAGGKVCYEVKWVGSKEIKTDLGANSAKHVVRVGWSDLMSDLQLGEEKFSYAYDSSGKFYVDNEEPKEGGEAFAKDDVVTSYLNMESDPVEIHFYKNGTVVGTPLQIPKGALEGKILFPHILVRNTNVEMNFGNNEAAHPLLVNYQMVGKVGDDVEYKVRGPQRAATKGECEFIMLCGMACSGKTRWAKEKKLSNPDQHFNILGTSIVVERVVKDIAVSGLLMKAGKFVEKLVDIAPSRRRNYILDQSNVLTSVQRRKAGGFDGFKRRAVVILPSDEEYQNRIKSREQEQGKSVPKSTVLDMKAGFRLPEVGDLFNDVEFPELGKIEAEELIASYNKEGVAAGYGQRPLTVRGGGPRPNRGMRGGQRGGPGRGFFRGDLRGGRGGWWRGPMGRGGPPPFRGGPPPRGFNRGRFPGMAIPSIDRVSREPNRGFGRGGPRGIPPLAGIRRGNGGGGMPPRGMVLGRGRGGGSWDRPVNGGPTRAQFPRSRGGSMNRGGSRGGNSGSSMYNNNNASSWGGAPSTGGFGGQGRFSGSPSTGFSQTRFGGGNPSVRGGGGQSGSYQNQTWGQGGNPVWDRGSTGGFESFGNSGGGGGSMGNQFADPWTQQVPDQGYGQSWDNSGSSMNMGGSARGGVGGGTWQGYGGQTYGNFNSGGYGRK